jgi:hypothetical protein
MKFPRLHRSLSSFLLGVSLAAGAAATSAAPPEPGKPALPPLAVEDVQVGQRGYGLSVFAGKEPERFEVEVIGVLRNTNGPDSSYILARLTGKGLEKSGVIAGMSGSPVFFDGRLAGAVAFGWPFSQEAIAGITPIASMHKLGTFGGSGLAPDPMPLVSLPDLLAGRIPADLLATSLARLAPKMTAGAAGGVPGIQWFASGFGDRSLGVLRLALGNVVPAGRASPSADPAGAALQPGSAVAAVMVDGDLRLAATGTVTDRIGDKIFAFGHPFLGLGPVQVPMASAEILTVMSSQYSSFKLSNVGEVIGAFEQDRQAGIEGRLGVWAPMIPLSIRVEGANSGPARQFRMRMMSEPLLIPALVGSAVLGSLEAASYTAGPQGLDVVAKFRVAGSGEVSIEQSFDGPSAANESASTLLSVASYLAQNPLQTVKIEAIDITLTQIPQPRSTSIDGVHADRSVVQPGEKVTLSLDLTPYRGRPLRHTTAITLPEDLPDGKYTLWIGDGRSADAVRLGIAPADPVRFEQALDLLRSLHSRRDLTILGVVNGPGLAIAGEVLPRLPASVRSLWGAAGSGSAAPLRSALVQEIHQRMPMPLEGMVKVELEVRRRDPVPGSGSEVPAIVAESAESAERAKRERR